ncbi:uncharacterized protein LOC125863693 [Solanum stenotomum]|uniref:uncharacterized protein LOC125863693 n=1 Tax=Solanum stenotomum TaxID=172797 RepID=UPI0020D1C1F1|nr:uncharacterized protein LOC125863693 [Solanum stenotomum]
MKELVTKRRVLDCETIEMPQTCGAVMTKNIVLRKDDPWDFTIPCIIGICTFAKALCDLGASVNLMPLMIFNKFGLDELNPTNMRLLMDDRSIKRSVGVVYDMLVKVDKFVFPDDFVVLDCEIDNNMLVSLVRPLLVMGKALVDVKGGELKF